VANLARAAILGYGNQGAAQAHCLRLSGWQVVVGTRPGRAADRAAEAGFEVKSLAEAAAQADVVAALLPDEVFPQLYAESLKAALRPGTALVFAHGFAIHFGGVEWPEGLDVVLVSPTAPGSVLAQEFDAGRGVPAYLAVAVDASGRAWERAEQYARMLGCHRAALLRTTVEEEVVIDLFGEQTVLVGGLIELLSAAVDTLVEAGYSPEMAYLECVHQIKFLADLLHREGPQGFLDGISATALYGALTRGRRVVGVTSRKAMAEVLSEVRDGSFAREFLDDQRTGAKRLAALLREVREGRVHRLEAARPSPPAGTDSASAPSTKAGSGPPSSLTRGR
jgi:ketol-acid reductoisomerase